VHHETPALVVCTRCGAFACEACAVLTRAPLVCRAGEPFLDVLPSRRATWSVWLAGGGFVGLFCGPFIPLLSLVVLPLALVAGPVGLVLARVERGAINRGEAPASGAGRVSIATVLGLLHLGVLLVGISLLVLSKTFF
jgi:hypothetical protein